MNCNIANEYITYSKNSIKKYLQLILSHYFDEDIYDDLINAYINTRYYNIYPKVSDVFEENIVYYLKKSLQDVKDDANYKDKARIMFKAFKYILYFDGVIENDSVRNIISEIEEFRKEGLNLYDSGFEAKMYTLLEESLLSKQNFLDSFNDKNFEVNYIKVKNGVFYCQLEHNIKFSKLYSSYAINKVFNNKVISEQKLFVLYPLVAVKALTDILKGDFTRKYVVDYVMDIASKERKNNKLLNYINNDTLKEKLILKLNYSDFSKDKDKVYNLTRNGFKIALNIDKDFELKEEESKLVKLFYFIFTSDEEVYNKFNDKLNIIYMPEKREI